MSRLLLFIFTMMLGLSIKANEVCLATEKDTADAKNVLQHANEYLGLLNNITFLSFKSINVSSDAAASLVEEKEKLKVNFTKISSSAKSIVNGENNCVAREWNIILFYTATSIRMMNDLEKFGLIKECKVCWFSVVVLSQSHENLSYKLKNL